MDSKDFQYDSRQKLGEKFKNIISQDENALFQNELKRMRPNYSQARQKNSKRAILEKYPLISKLTVAHLALPHSVPVERIFTQLQDF